MNDHIPPNIGVNELERLLRQYKEELTLLFRQDTGWIAPTLLNGWIDYGATFSTAAYRRRNGITYLDGLIKNGTIGAVVFNLPLRFRPRSLTRLFPSVDGTNTANARIDIGDNGDVVVVAGNNGFVSLAGISFPADQ